MPPLAAHKTIRMGKVSNKTVPEKPIALRGGTVIDATGRAPIKDAVVVIEGDRIGAIGKTGEVAIPDDAAVIDVSGQTLLPGFIDGHCHLEDFVGELYLHFGVTTAPDIQTTRDEWWSLAQRDGTNMGKIRGPRVWSAGRAIGEGPDMTHLLSGRGFVGTIPVQSPDEAIQAVRDKKKLGLDQLKLMESLSGDILQAVVDESHKLGFSAISHSTDVIASAKAGVNAVEHHWSIGLTSIGDVSRRKQFIADRWGGKLDTEELAYFYDTGTFDRIIDAMVANDVTWSPTIATWFRPLSASAGVFREKELSILNHPRTGYLPPVLRAVTLGIYDRYERWPAEKLDRIKRGYENIQEFIRRFTKAGGLVRAGSDPNHGMPALDVHEEMKMFVEAGLTPMQAIQAATINVAKTFGKDKDFGTLERGKVADIVMVDGDPLADVWATQDVQMVFMAGNLMDIQFSRDHKNPIPSAGPWRLVPKEIQIRPRSILEGSKQAILVVKPLGSRVAPWHKVVLNGKELETKFINSSELQAVVDSQTIEHAGLYPVVVVSPKESGGVSNPAHLIVTFAE
jgi:imidazolonepropionase-like amidohydrolase